MPDINSGSTAKTTSPLVFISHDTRDAEFAEAFSNLLKGVSTGVLKSFRSSDKKTGQGIEFGVEWYPEIIRNIQSASDVVCLLTENSINRPWILFEAGMAKGKLDTPILGVALGIELKDASTGPFAQFQNCADDEESLTKLITQLVGRVPNAEPDPETIKFQVKKFKSNISSILEKNKKPLAAKPKAQDLQSTVASNDIENSSVKLFEEIKIMFKDLPAKIEKSNNGEYSRRRRRIHPGMIHDLVDSTGSTKLGIRIALSLYKEKLPWVYEEGNRIISRYSGLKTSPSEVKRIYREMEELLLVLTRSPIVEYIVEDEYDILLLKDLPKIILHATEKLFLSNRDIVEPDLNG